MVAAKTPTPVLLIEDDPADADLVVRFLHRFAPVRYQVTLVFSVAHGVAQLERSAFEAVVLNLGVPDAFELNGLRRIQEARADVPVIVSIGNDDHDLALRAVQAGAQDCLIKRRPYCQLLARAISYAIERKRTERVIHSLAYHDGLTGLPNRLLLHDRICRALAQARRHEQLFALLYIDVDEFKEFNDTLGHDGGDTVLKVVADRLREAVRSTDTVARVGGDEFIVLLGQLDRPSDAAVVAAKVQASLARPFDLAGRAVSIPASIGVAVWPHDGDSADHLLENADAAMYRAKHGSRGGTYRFYSKDMDAADTAQLDGAEMMWRAFERGQFQLYYQPIIDLRDGRISAVEALLRRVNPAGVPQCAAEFITEAEANRLIIPIGEWVMREAIRQFGCWQRDGFSVGRVCVNISSCELTGGHLPRLVSTTVEAYHRRLHLGVEIREGSVQLNQRRAITILQELHAMGVHIAVDDFGMASLDHLRRFPADAVKLAPSFVSNVAQEKSARTIVQGIIQVVHGMGKEVVAEGVETEDQLSCLIDSGCDQAQGHFFSTALTPAEIPAVLKRRITKLGVSSPGKVTSP